MFASKSAVISLFLFTSTGAAIGWTQETPKIEKFGVFGGLGYGHDISVYDPDTPAYEVGMINRMSPKLDFELYYSYLQKNWKYNNYEGQNTAHFFGGGIVYHFTETRLRPFVLAGAGLNYRTYQSRYMGYNGKIRNTDDHNALLAFTYGAGVEVFFNEALSLRPQIRYQVPIAAGGFLFAFAFPRASVLLSYRF